MTTHWMEAARAWGRPVFPIAIAWDGRKHQKRPLTEHGHHDATMDVDGIDWTGANGFGLPMGDGLYALDVDTYKSVREPMAWMTQFNIDPKFTRAHKTVSGGAHLIFKLPIGFENLLGRQNIVPGLDARGAGGWIAFGEGYSVHNDCEPVTLGTRVCEDIRDNHSGKGVVRGGCDPISIGGRPDKALIAKVQNLVDRRRKFGDRLPAKDGDRSAHLFAIAYWMRRYNFTPEEFASTVAYLSPSGGHVLDMKHDWQAERALGRAWNYNSGVGNAELTRKMQGFAKWMK
ncbi:MAG: bifunctional DNA primase/polymerase [Paracoccaceae bacterium]